MLCGPKVKIGQLVIAHETSLLRASFLGPQHDAARISWGAAERRRLQHGGCSAPAPIDRYLLLAGRSAENPPAVI